MKLVSFLRANSDLEYTEQTRRFPWSLDKFSGDELHELNELCHVSAFSFEKNHLNVDISVCNSCGDCSSYARNNISLKELSTKEYGLISLAMNRDE